MRAMILVIVLAAGVVGTASAQAPLRTTYFDAVTPSPYPSPFPSAYASPSSEDRTLAMIFGGVVGGAIGTFAGGYIGALITSNDDVDDDLDFLPGLIWGATVGESLLLAAGVHAGNKRQGKVLPSMLVSTAIGLAGVALALGTQDSEPLPGIILGLTPVAQLFTTIAIERRTAR